MLDGTARDRNPILHGKTVAGLAQPCYTQTRKSELPGFR